MIKEILLVHHTHTDIGYTHPQPVVFELHDRFIDMALDLADASAGDRDDGRFRWTCEVTGTTRSWWDRACSSDRDRFLAAVGRGQFEVAALEWHLTPLADLRMLVRSLRNVQFFRNLGIPVHSAMNTDVNGVPWGLVDVLLDHGISGFSMSANSHMGGPVSPRPGAFRWVSPDGRDLLVWNGYQYWHAANVLMQIPSSVDAVARALPSVLLETERRGYELSYLPLQITNLHHPDNATPDSQLSEFVCQWNDRNPSVRIRTVLLSEVFDRLDKEVLPTLSGDWTDYWNFGAGSSARETSIFQEGLRVLDAAHGTSIWPIKPERREASHLDAAHEDLALYAEHTWGADCSVSAPHSVETNMQWALKSRYAYEGLAHARIVMRDSLHRLAERSGGEEPTLLIYNPLAVSVKMPMLLPVHGLEWSLTPGIHHIQRLDGALVNVTEGSKRWCDIECPALGYRTYRLDSLPFSGSECLESHPHFLMSGRVFIGFDDNGGVNTLLVDGKEFVGTVSCLKFGVPILERPSGGSRNEIMNIDFSKIEPAEGWNRDWDRTLDAGRLDQSIGRIYTGCVEHIQTFEMVNGDRVQVIYRLFADDPSVDVEVVLTSSGDSEPYSLMLPFTLPEEGKTTWHFDTAGALVEFDREQLPNAARHFVTTQRFVRMQTDQAAWTIATPDLPLWKFGGAFFDLSSHLNPAERQPVMLAWLSNNYWEVNFLANQTGQSKFRFRLLPHAPESVDASYMRALPYAFPPRLHAYRELGPVVRTTESLLDIDGEGISVESISKAGPDTLVTVLNLRNAPNSLLVRQGVLEWNVAWRAGLDGSIKDNAIKFF